MRNFMIRNKVLLVKMVSFLAIMMVFSILTGCSCDKGTQGIDGNSPPDGSSVGNSMPLPNIPGTSGDSGASQCQGLLPDTGSSQNGSGGGDNAPKGDPEFDSINTLTEQEINDVEGIVTTVLNDYLSINSSNQADREDSLNKMKDYFADPSKLNNISISDILGNSDVDITIITASVRKIEWSDMDGSDGRILPYAGVRITTNNGDHFATLWDVPFVKSGDRWLIEKIERIPDPTWAPWG